MAQINVYSFGSDRPEADHPETYRSRVCVQYHREHLGTVAIGVQRHVGMTQDSPAHWDEDGGLWSDMDRKGCNDLIRAVREARDKAFGRDE